MTTHAILVTVADRPGMLYGLSKVLAEFEADVKYVDIHQGDPHSEIYFEFVLTTVRPKRC